MMVRKRSGGGWRLFLSDWTSDGGTLPDLAAEYQHNPERVRVLAAAYSVPETELEGLVARIDQAERILSEDLTAAESLKRDAIERQKQELRRQEDHDGAKR